MPRQPSVPNLIWTANAMGSPSATNPNRRAGNRSAGFRRRLAQVRLGIEPGSGEVVLQDLTDHFLEGDLGAPAQPGSRLAGVATQVGNLRGTKVRLVHLDMVLPVEPDQPESELDQLADRPLDTGGDDVISGLVLLQHHPHRLDVILGLAPVALGIEIPEPEVWRELG